MLPFLLSVALAAPLTGPTCAGPVAHIGADHRPVLSGPERTRSSSDGFFLLHWTDEGADRMAIDEDADGVPDHVQVADDALVDARARFEADGWRPLVPDDGEGGTDQIDVYLTQIDAFGYANADEPAEGEDGHACYVRLDPENLTRGDEVAASVARHELHHCVQYRYSVRSASWIYEGSATLEQYREDDDPGLAVLAGVLWAQRLNGQDQPLDAVGNRFEYASFIWFKHWAERRGGAGSLTGLWEALDAEPAWQRGLETAAQDQFGEDLPSVHLDHAVWNAFACARDDGAHYLASPAGCAGAPGASVDIEELRADATDFEVTLPAGPYSATFLSLPAVADTRPRVTCDAANMRLAVVDVGIDGAAGEVVTGLTRATGAPTTGSTLLVLTNPGAWEVDVTCEVSRLVVAPPDEDPGGCDTVGGAPWGLLLALAGLLRRRRP